MAEVREQELFTRRPETIAAQRTAVLFDALGELPAEKRATTLTALAPHEMFTSKVQIGPRGKGVDLIDSTSGMGSSEGPIDLSDAVTAAAQSTADMIREMTGLTDSQFEVTA